MTLPVVTALLYIYVANNPAIPFAKYLICSEQVDISEQMCSTFKNDNMLSKALQLVCYDLDILHNWSNEFFISNWFTSDLRNDLNTVRRSYQEIKELPEVDVILSFPITLIEATKAVEHNRKFKKWLEKQMQVFPTSSYYHQAYYDTEDLYLFWTAVKEAVDSAYTAKYRRMALGKMRDMLGADDWRDRRLLPSVPIWFFSELGG